MRKISLLLISLFFIINTYAQTNSGSLTYTVKPDKVMMDSILNQENTPSALKRGIQNLFDYQLKTLPHLTYRLDFNNKESLFSIPQNMPNDNRLDLQKTARNVGAYGKYFISQDEKMSYHQFEFAGAELIVTHPSDKFDWQITNESKLINGYQCYKAVTHYYPDAGLGGKITAWFTPSLPFQTGPIVYAGLPGLILELKQGYYIFTAEDINLSKKEKKIKKPRRGRLISSEDFPKEKAKIKANYIRSRG